ncbi:MAG: ComF family protein [Sphingobium sp.]
MGLSSHLSAIGTLILDYALPRRCPGCGDITGEQDRFCLTCWSDLHFLGGPCCGLCGLPFEVEPALPCEACLADPPPWASARAALAYGDIARKVTMRLKYGRRIGAARLMAGYMAHHLRGMEEQAEGRGALLVPVPLHRWRLWNRGFNQSALIAGHLGKASGIPVDPFVLRRSKATRPLRAMNPGARHREVRGAFSIDKRRADVLPGRTIILVDDVHTSGATARACARTLIDAGASRVHLLCWARVLPDGDDRAHT